MFCKDGAWVKGGISAYDIEGCEDGVVIYEEILGRMEP